MNTQTISDRLKAAMVESKLTRRGLAKTSGLTPNTIRAFVRGDRLVSPKNAQTLAAVLGHTPGYWLGEDEPAPVPVLVNRPQEYDSVHPLTGQLLRW